MNSHRKKRGWKKILVVIVIVAVAGVLIARTLARGKKEDPVETVKVSRGTVVAKLTETGNIELLRTVDVKSKIAGTVREILVNEGDEVTEGNDLCVIDPDPSQTLLLFQKRAAVDRTRINMEQAKRELDRKQELAKTSLISTKEVEEAENSYLISQNAYKLARQELEIMEREIETSGSGTEERVVASVVRAPYDGFISQRHIEEGDIVTSGISAFGSGTNLFQIGDPSTKIIRANISEVDIGRVRIGADVRIMLDAYPDTSFAGVLRHIAPVGTLNQGRNVVTFKTEVEIIDKDPRLRPGMSCDVDVIIDEKEDVHFLPLEAVYEPDNGAGKKDDEPETPIVYVKKDSLEIPQESGGLFGKKPDRFAPFKPMPVELGIKSDNRVQVIADIDTSTVVVSDARKTFEDIRAQKKKDKKGADGGKS